jgi:cytochrome P450
MTNSLVPEGTTCQIPIWSLHRDPRHFSPDPEGFWPERWLPEGPKVAEARGQEFHLNQNAYIPFNYGMFLLPLSSEHGFDDVTLSGPGNCVGRALALQEMRAVLSVLVRRFDFRFADGFRAEDWTNTLLDQYVLLRGKLGVVVSKRQ